MKIVISDRVVALVYKFMVLQGKTPIDLKAVRDGPGLWAVDMGEATYDYFMSHRLPDESFDDCAVRILEHHIAKHSIRGPGDGQHRRLM